MNAIVHLVSDQGAADFIDDFLPFRNFPERQSVRREFQPGEMLVQFEDAALVKAQTFPDRVSSLNGGIEWTYAGLIAVQQTPVDVNDEIMVPLVELLEHVEISVETMFKEFVVAITTASPDFPKANGKFYGSGMIGLE